jgi:hypothetical protein
VGGSHVVDVQVDVDLLRRTVGPLRRDVVRRELHGDSRLPVDDDAVPVVVGDDGAAEESCPERALRSEIGRVQDDDLSGDAHRLIFSCRPRRPHDAAGSRR